MAEAAAANSAALVAAGEANRLFACKCVAQKDPRLPRHDKSLELMVQGKVADRMVSFLTKRLRVPQKCIAVIKKKGI